MNARILRTVLATALVTGIAAGTAGPALATGAPAPGRTHTTAQATPGTDIEALGDLIAGLPDEGATAALIRLGGTEGAWRGSAGVHDLVTKRPADPDARFRAGSVTKVLTAATVLQLATEHRLGLDRPVRSYLPELIPAAYGDVTVRQLLNHTSGLPSADFPGDTVEEWYANRFHRFDARELVASATAKEREFPAGTRQHYLNINYTVAGLLIEKVTGHRYEAEVSRRILAPLGLRGTSFPGADPRIHGPHNHGYQRMELADGSTGLRDVSVWSPTDGWAAGDVISTTADLERFLTALFRGEVVRGPLLEEMFTLPDPSVRDFVTGKAPAYSAGLSSWELGGRRVWGKTGGRWGYNTGFGATRDLSRTLVYSINSTDAKAEGENALVMGVVGTVFGAPSAG
ncbi:serine hydrolase domain-containing protein [Streptomyces drozdowiczii]|uniref:serine hydrolase domain-containing protein n=1 Tax=Streptomyces drozdowiczii TaxID=202862 RepID=UPI00224722D6|nr:serine hydrolase domain-containing protein [Streptomyces drozdowiczii]MCX0246325.1 beta-lactamase family protein [Streptomyces drozdowiczii]